ncbi:MAG: ArsR/SmtB family transcription factor [Planctomycetota bacterium]|jgi:ArsR family transcriptional regulator
MPTPPPRLVTWLATLSDVARLRILRLLDREELSVGELARALQLPQSTVSRHLKVLHDGQWVRKRVEGTASYYRVLPEWLPDAARQLWQLTKTQLETSPTLDDDDHRLTEVLAERRTDSRSFFGRVGGEWDHLRQELFGSGFTAEALLSLIEPRWVVADLGCGTGNASEWLSPLVHRVIAVDREPSMLDAARMRLEALNNVEFRQGDLHALPIDDAHVDAAVVMLVLHHVEQPLPVVAEMARILRSPGRLLIVDMVRHDREIYRQTMGHHHLGFDENDVGGWCSATGLQLTRFLRLHPDTSVKGPGLFAATLEKRP